MFATLQVGISNIIFDIPAQRDMCQRDEENQSNLLTFIHPRDVGLIRSAGVSVDAVGDDTDT